jgi:hypothetical protein
MDGRKLSTSNAPLEELSAIHKKQGDEYVLANDYVAAIGQYTYALNHLIYNADLTITHHQILLCRSNAYIHSERYNHARCDLYTIMANNPTAATLRDCYSGLRALYLAENNLSEVAEEKLALHCKKIFSDTFKLFVDIGVAKDVQIPKPESFLTRQFRSLSNFMEEKSAPKKVQAVTETELIERTSVPSARG